MLYFEMQRYKKGERRRAKGERQKAKGENKTPKPKTQNLRPNTQYPKITSLQIFGFQLGFHFRISIL
jgi:hypothetical protein